MEKSVYRARVDSSSIFSFLLCIILLEMGGMVFLRFSNCKTRTTHLLRYISYQQINTIRVVGHGPNEVFYNAAVIQGYAAGLHCFHAGPRAGKQFSGLIQPVTKRRGSPLSRRAKSL